MMMVELTSVPSASLPVDDLADHLRLSRGVGDAGSQDANLEACLRAAMSAIEARIGKVLFERRFALSLTGWHDPTCHRMPVAPVRQIDSVKVITRAGQETTLSSDDYVLRQDAHQPRVEALGSFPTPAQGGAIEIEFTAGFGADWESIPSDLRQAILVLSEAFWAQNLDPDAGMPAVVSALLEPHRPLRLRGAVG